MRQVEKISCAIPSYSATSILPIYKSFNKFLKKIGEVGEDILYMHVKFKDQNRLYLRGMKKTNST